MAKTCLSSMLMVFVVCNNSAFGDKTTCTHECDAGYYFTKGKCTKCTAEFMKEKKYDEKTSYCKEFGVEVTFETGNDIAARCEAALEKVELQSYVVACKNGYKAKSDYTGCVKECPSGTKLSADGKTCEQTCPAGTELVENKCWVKIKDDGGYNPLINPDNLKMSGKAYCNIGSYIPGKQALKEEIAKAQKTGTAVKICKTCTELPEVYYCPSIKETSIILDEWLGVKECPSGKKRDDSATKCFDVNNDTGGTDTSTTSSNVSPCEAGQVRFNGQCIACTTHPAWVQFAKEARVYCPGGDTQGAPIVQQLQFCSAGARPNATLSGCECMYGKTTSKGLCESIKITKEQLKCGPNGCSVPKEQQCWTRNTPESYKKCMGF